MIPQTIHVSLEKSAAGNVVTCHYHVRSLIPTLLLPPHCLEREVQELASECKVETTILQ